MPETDKAPGIKQVWDADAYVRQAGYVAELGQPVLGLLCPVAGERILDLGCGDGRLSITLAEAGASVVGCDSSPEMVDSARAAGVDARVVEAQRLPFDNEFDAVFSNAALHWMKDSKSVLSGVHRALLPGGRFIAEFGGFGNIAAITAAMTAVLHAHGYDGARVNPWFFPTAEAYRLALENAGFLVSSINLFARPTKLPQGMKKWLDMFAPAFFQHTGPASEQLKEEVVQALKPVLQDERGVWYADHVRLRFAAFKN